MAFRKVPNEYFKKRIGFEFQKSSESEFRPTDGA